MFNRPIIDCCFWCFAYTKNVVTHKDCMDSAQKQALINYLASSTIATKFEKMEAIVQNRTRHVTLVMEDLYQPHNASAVLRSAECFGIQDIHVIEQRNRFKATHGIAMGAAKWLDLSYYTSIQECFSSLKTRGYTLVATTLHPQAIPLPELPLDNKIALIFGTEHSGLSTSAQEHADIRLTIPMYGFTQSFNVSVSAALALSHITNALRSSSIAWQLTHEEQLDLILSWLKRTIKGAPELERRFLQGNNI